MAYETDLSIHGVKNLKLKRFTIQDGTVHVFFITATTDSGTETHINLFSKEKLELKEVGNEFIKQLKEEKK